MHFFRYAAFAAAYAMVVALLVYPRPQPRGAAPLQVSAAPAVNDTAGEQAALRDRSAGVR